MAPPPTPPPLPPPDYFTKKATAAAAMAAANQTSSSSLALTSQTLPTIHYADTISDGSPFIPITLDLPKHNYYHWRHLFEVHLGRCNLLDHVAANSVPRPTDPRWVKDNLAIIQWIYQRVSTEIFNLVFRDTTNAAALWMALRQLFQDNVDARVNTLHTELRNTAQGDSPVGVYCQKLKTIADELRELGDPVDDRQLINVLLVGLSERFENQASFIPMMRPVPSFAEVRSMLQWADRALTNKEARHQAFAAVQRPPVPAPPAPPPPPAVQPPPGWHPSPNYRGRNPIYRPPRPTSTPAAPPSGPPPSAPAPPASPSWRPPHDPWTGLVQAWSMPWMAPSPLGAPSAYGGAWAPGLRPHIGAPGLLGTRPPQQAYMTAPTYYPYGTPAPPPSLAGSYQPLYAPPLPAPLPGSPATSSSTPTWDQAAFLQAMNQFVAQGFPDQGGDRTLQ